MIVITLIFQFTLMHMPKNLEKASAQVLTQLRHCKHTHLSKYLEKKVLDL